MNTQDPIEGASLDEIWQAVFRLLEQSSVSGNLQWVQPLELSRPETLGDGLKIPLLAPNEFTADWVMKPRFKDAIEGAFAQVLGKRCEISLTSKAPGEQESLLSTVGLKTAVAPSMIENAYIAVGGGISTPPASVSTPSPSFLGGAPSLGSSIQVGRDQGLEARYTFESFVVGASNQFAHASAVAVAEQPARQYNPLFLYSPPGLGKTHLLHAIGNHFLAKNPNGRVAYLSAEKFVNELVESLQKGKMSQFRMKYRDSFDMILIDDIQFIAKKSASEEEFFHTFNALHSSKRQIVVTSDRPPKEIDGLEERIRTRFEWGLIGDICPPEIETRIAILKAKAERDDIYLPDDVATFLASYIKSNVRELEGVLIRLQAQTSLTGAEISLDMAKAELKTAIPDEGSHITVESIQNAVAKHFHIKMQDLKSTSRARAVAFPRQIAMYLVRKYGALGFKEIGQYFGGKDHTTVMHACNKVEEDIDRDPDMREAVEAIQNLL